MVAGGCLQTLTCVRGLGPVLPALSSSNDAAGLHGVGDGLRVGVPFVLFGDETPPCGCLLGFDDLRGDADADGGGGLGDGRADTGAEIRLLMRRATPPITAYA